MKIDLELVSRVARLAALELAPGEADGLSQQLTRIVEHFEALRSLPEELLSGLLDSPPTPLREDVATPGAGGSHAEANAPEFSHGHFVVPRVLSRGE